MEQVNNNTPGWSCNNALYELWKSLYGNNISIADKSLNEVLVDILYAISDPTIDNRLYGVWCTHKTDAYGRSKVVVPTRGMNIYFSYNYIRLSEDEDPCWLIHIDSTTSLGDGGYDVFVIDKTSVSSMHIDKIISLCHYLFKYSTDPIIKGIKPLIKDDVHWEIIEDNYCATTSKSISILENILDLYTANVNIGGTAVYSPIANCDKGVYPTNVTSVMGVPMTGVHFVLEGYNDMLQIATDIGSPSTSDLCFHVFISLDSRDVKTIYRSLQLDRVTHEAIYSRMATLLKERYHE